MNNINYQKDTWYMEITISPTSEVQIYARHPNSPHFNYGFNVYPVMPTDIFFTSFEGRILKAYFKVLDYCNNMNKQIEQTNLVVEKVINVD